MAFNIRSQALERIQRTKHIYICVHLQLSDTKWQLSIINTQIFMEKHLLHLFRKFAYYSYLAQFSVVITIKSFI